MNVQQWEERVRECSREIYRSTYREPLVPFSEWIKNNDPTKPRKLEMRPEQWESRMKACIDALCEELNAIPKEKHAWQPERQCCIEVETQPGFEPMFVLKFKTLKGWGDMLGISTVCHYRSIRDLMRHWNIRISEYSQVDQRWYCQPL